MRARNVPAAPAERRNPAATQPSKEAKSIRVQDIMTTDVEACNATTDLGAAAMIMWRRDCGFVPVVDTVTKKVVGAITDRDICMAVATQGRRPSEIRVGDVISGSAYTCSSSDPVRKALDLMREKRVRRLPVLDAQGEITGILSLNDVVRHARTGRGKAGPGVEPEEIVEAFQAICEHLQPA